VAGNTPTDTPAAISVRQRLQNAGASLGLSQNEMMRLYLIDGFLRRLSASAYHGQFILSGAYTLYKVALGPTRMRLTQGAEYSVNGVANDPTALRDALAAICVVGAPDLALFDPDSILVALIMPNHPDAGLQARITAYIGKARDTVTLDCSFNPVFPPGPQTRLLPATLPPESDIPVWTVPVEDIMAGKVESMLRRGAANTRFKDYWDIAQLTRTLDFDGALLSSTLLATCAYHGTALDTTNVVFAGAAFLTDPAQLAGWSRFLKRLRGSGAPSLTFTEAIAAVRALYGPVIAGQITPQTTRTWSHGAHTWS
jgi:Nucleotidyl transferase AbiEii toxin, Type IV TA system